MMDVMKIELYVAVERTNQWKEDHPKDSTERAEPHTVSFEQVQGIVLTVFEDNGIEGMMLYEGYRKISGMGE